MMKTILVPVGGAESDPTVMQIALAAASPLAAHLDFLHMRQNAAESARHTPHVEFARGPAIHNALAELESDAEARSANAGRHVRDFCRTAGIRTSETPRASRHVTAAFREEHGDALPRLVFHARHHDLTVVARPGKSDGLPRDRVEQLLLGSGRPLLIAPAKAPAALLDDVVICWKEGAAAARALAAAMPLLTAAKRVHVVAAAESGADVRSGLDGIVAALGWHGVTADAAAIEANHPAAETLCAFAQERRASLMVMGGYSHSRARESVFGGCTQAMMGHADTAVFITH